jgi:RES domain-containing protein
MEVFRICHNKWAGELIASGFPGRWNSKDIYTIYSAASRSLACLENIVHTSGISLSKDMYKVIVIKIPKSVEIKKVSLSELPKNWHLPTGESYEICQAIGDQWNLKKESAILEVPSAIITNEMNYLINTLHKDFKKIKLVSSEPFFFDPRIKK